MKESNQTENGYIKRPVVQNFLINESIKEIS